MRRRCIKDTSQEQDIWYQYELIGEQTLSVEVAVDQGSCVVFVRSQVGVELKKQVQIAMYIFGKYTIK